MQINETWLPSPSLPLVFATLLMSLKPSCLTRLYIGGHYTQRTSWLVIPVFTGSHFLFTYLLVLTVILASNKMQPDYFASNRQMLDP